MRSLQLVLRLAALAACAASLGADPMLPLPIAPQEKAAAEAVADYLARGPVAFFERLTADAPLRELNQKDAFAEIEVRAGEPAGAAWTMMTARPGGAAFEVNFPSGVDELVMFDMKQETGRWRIASIRVLAELNPLEHSRMKARVVSQPASSSEGTSQPSPESLESLRYTQRMYVARFAIIALLLSMLGGAMRHRRRVLSTFILTAAAISFCLQIAIIINGQLINQSPVAAIRSAISKPVPFAELRKLRSFRRAMTRGDELPPFGNLDPEIAETAKLWTAQSTPNDSVDLSTTILSTTPLAELLRARAAADAGHNEDAALLYSAFRANVNATDAFWFEQFSVQKAKPETGPAVAFKGSRDAGTCYVQSMVEVAGGSAISAREDFREGWRMQPMTRPDVVRAGFFAGLLRDPMISILVNLDAPEESRTADVELGRSPMVLPASAKASASGTFVRITIGRQSLDIPGGAGIAPRNTEVVAATEWKRRVDADALEDFEPLLKSHLSTPSARRRAQQTADALAEHNRWADVIRLTDAIVPNADTMPMQLLVARVRALLRVHRTDEARSLAKSPAIGRSMQRTGAEPGTLMSLAELQTQAGAYEDAIDTYKRVESTKNGPDVAGRIRQVNLRLLLAASRPTASTAHFEIHSMPDVPVTVAERVGQILEAELSRVTSRITVAQFSRVRVNILFWEDFSGQLTGSDDVVGFYDGDITIPFGAVARFRQGVVAILTHEMTHAVIAQASDDNAPRWFQEGLARRMELVERADNIFAIRASSQITSISVLDAQLESQADPQSTGDAYTESATFMRFLEDRYGPQSINSLIASYRTGANTDEAFVSVTKRTTVDLDREFREWGMTHTAEFIDHTPWPYTQFYSLGVDPKVSGAFHWSKKPAAKP